MPRKGYKGVTISEAMHEIATEFIEAENKSRGYRHWRSISQFVETAIADFVKDRAIEKTVESS